MPIEFRHGVSEAEHNSLYLNLKGEDGRGYGTGFPPHKTKLAVFDQEGRRFYTKKHHGSQLWRGIEGGLGQWFEANEVIPGTVISVRYDPDEKTSEGDHVIHLEVTGKKSNPVVEEVENEEEEEGVEIPLEFERQLEDFVEKNLALVEQGLELFVDEDGNRGRQYPTDVGRIDLLCLRPNGDLVVIELKRGRGSDRVVGQISRYIGWVQAHLVDGHDVYGVIITHEYDKYLSYAVAANSKLSLLYYRIKLEFVGEQEIKNR